MDNHQDIHISEEASNGQNKKRRADDLEGETIHPDSFKRTLIAPDTLVSDSNKCTFLRLECNPDAFGCKEYVFNPEYTNQIFREDEEIHGYRDLAIDIHLLSGSLHAYVNVEYKEKLPNADPVEFQLKEHFNQGFLSKEKFVELLKSEKEFRPLGEKVYEYEKIDSPGFVYEVYHCKFSTPGFPEYNDRLQVFVKFFIDGASYVEHTDFWDYYILYQKDPNGIYTVCGYCTTYSFYLRADKKRVRVSQFIILPPFQRKAHGTALLKVVYEKTIKDPECVELTVEDASEDFQSLRDILDTRFIVTKGFFPWALKYKKTPPTLEEYKAITLTKDEMNQIRQEFKFTKNQIRRVFEILQLAVGDMNNMAYLMEYRNKIKARLYFANRAEFLPFLKKKYPLLIIDDEVIKPKVEEFISKNMPKDEVEEKLEEYWQEILEGYSHILKKIDLILETSSNSQR